MQIKNREDWVYLINFYGQYSRDEIVSYAKEYKNLIVDNVQAFYTKPIEGVDTIYTCRKFFGVPDGGYLYAYPVIVKPVDRAGSIGISVAHNKAELEKAYDYAMDKSLCKEVIIEEYIYKAVKFDACLE